MHNLKRWPGMQEIPPVLMFAEIDDPKELALTQAQADQFDHNADWLEAHGHELFPRYRGMYVCVACQEPFVAETAAEAIRMARAAHPEDDGRFLYRVPREKTHWIYAS